MLGADLSQGLDFAAVEQAARRFALECMRRLLEQRLNADREDRECTARCGGCGQSAPFKGYRAKTFRTALGELTLERAYYHCAACDRGWHPRDAELGLEGRSVSPGLERMIGSAAADASFARGSELLRELAELHVPTTQVERVAKELGTSIAADERTVLAPEPARAPTAYVGLDGTGVPMRAAETAGRAGKQADGRAKTRESKLVTYWTAEQRNAAGRPERDPGSVRYSAAIESAASRDTDADGAPFGQRLRRMAERCSYADAPRRVVLGDGAAWIWNLADRECPGAIQIVDLWHAKEKLWECGKALWGAGPRTEEWARARSDDLEQGRFAELLAALRPHAEECEAFRLGLGYFEANRERMRYDEFREGDLCVGSGIVEAGCKTVVGARCKRSGMHWTVDGANAILALRCSVLSGRYADYWERRAAAA